MSFRITQVVKYLASLEYPLNKRYNAQDMERGKDANFFHLNLKWPNAITRPTVHFMCGLMSDLVICKFRKCVVIHDPERPYWDPVSLNNTNQPANHICFITFVSGQWVCKPYETNLSKTNILTFWLGMFWLGMLWLWDSLILGRFDYGTFWLGTFCHWDVLIWDVLTLGVLTLDVLTLGCFDLWLFDSETFWPVTDWAIVPTEIKHNYFYMRIHLCCLLTACMAFFHGNYFFVVLPVLITM